MAWRIKIEWVRLLNKLSEYKDLEFPKYLLKYSIF